MSRVVLVSGGASGIGAALATAHVMAGDTVVVADLHPRDPSHVLLDVRDREAFAAVARAVVDRHGRIDVFYDNAGIAVAGGIEELTPEHWDSAIDVNLRGVIHGVEAVYPVMRAQGHGHIVITASLAGLIPVPLLGPYTVTGGRARPGAAARGRRLRRPGLRPVPGVRADPHAREHQPRHRTDRGQPDGGGPGPPGAAPDPPARAGGGHRARRTTPQPRDHRRAAGAGPARRAGRYRRLG